MTKTHGDCVKITMHFHDRAEARAVLDAASLDEKRMFQIALERCDQ